MFRHHRQPHVSANFGGSCCPRVAPGNPSWKLGYGRLAQTSCAASLNAGPWQRPADGPTRRYSLDRMMLLRVATQPAYGKGLKRTSVSTSRRRTRTRPEGWLFVGATSTKQRGAGVRLVVGCSSAAYLLLSFSQSSPWSSEARSPGRRRRPALVPLRPRARRSQTPRLPRSGTNGRRRQAPRQVGALHPLPARRRLRLQSSRRHRQPRRR